MFTDFRTVMALSKKLVVAKRVWVGGLRLYMNQFHATSPSQEAVFKLTYCLINLTGTL